MNLLTPAALRNVFIEQLSILYSAKNHLIGAIPELVQQSTFNNLKLALGEDLHDTKLQMVYLRDIFTQLKESAITDNCLAMDAIVKEARNQVLYNESNFYESDMSIIFYMNVIENMQVGACRILNIITKKPEYQQYDQLVKQCLDMDKDNAKLFKCVAAEYLGE